MTASHDMEGTPVSEEEVAKGLGFANVTEFRRWQTDLGHEVLELKHALRQMKDESEGFRWHGLRQRQILEECRKFLQGFEVTGNILLPEIIQHPQSLRKLIPKLILAINVVTGTGEPGQNVDWNHELDDWLKPLNLRT
jgi:hypothetical protein